MIETPLEKNLSFEEQHKVVQNNTSYYDLKWSMVGNPSKNNTWNWVAFFFTAFWLAYRKMYKPFFILGIIEFLWLSLSHFIDISIWADAIFFLGVSLVVGWNSNRWYYNHTVQVLGKSKSVLELHQKSYLKTKGGTHIGIMIGLNTLIWTLFIEADLDVLSYLPTKTNVKDVVRYTGEADTLEVFTDNPKWKYVKKEGRYHVLEFNGYDYSEKEDVRIVFYVYLDKQLYEWKNVYINGRKLNKEEAEDYEFWIEDNSWY